MLKMGKNKFDKVKVSYRSGIMLGFGIMVLLGFGIPYIGFGAGNTVSAASGLSVTASSDQSVANDTSVVYTYNKLSLRDAYPYYIAASFIVAGGLSLYALSYIPSKSERRSRYASRYTTLARTTY